MSKEQSLNEIDFDKFPEDGIKDKNGHQHMKGCSIEKEKTTCNCGMWEFISDARLEEKENKEKEKMLFNVDDFLKEQKHIYEKVVEKVGEERYLTIARYLYDEIRKSEIVLNEVIKNHKHCLGLEKEGFNMSLSPEEEKSRDENYNKWKSINERSKDRLKFYMDKLKREFNGGDFSSYKNKLTDYKLKEGKDE